MEYWDQIPVLRPLRTILSRVKLYATWQSSSSHFLTRQRHWSFKQSNRLMCIGRGGAITTVDRSSLFMRRKTQVFQDLEDVLASSARSFIISSRLCLFFSSRGTVYETRRIAVHPDDDVARLPILWFSSMPLRRLPDVNVPE